MSIRNLVPTVRRLLGTKSAWAGLLTVLLGVAQQAGILDLDAATLQNLLAILLGGGVFSLRHAQLKTHDVVAPGAPRR
ncbi:MAG: hypothetical protein AAGC60_20795 [Acidobacteriota bacterium]